MMPARADVVVAGSGAAGLTAALAAAVSGASVLLVERGERLGGTTALSGGRVWVPGNHLSGGDTPAAAAAYLDGVFSGQYGHMTEVFLRTAPEMALFVERNSAHRFAACPRYPDYDPSRPGATTGGRALDTAPIDTGKLTPWRRTSWSRRATCRCPSRTGRAGATPTGSTGNCCASGSGTASGPVGWRWSPGCLTAW
jgi:choline dehydrogenase-like flavoprotein